jgi:hypothetical protein
VNSAPSFRERSTPSRVREPIGDAVPSLIVRGGYRPSLLSPAARKGVRNRMLLFRQTALDRIANLSGVPTSELRRFCRELREGSLPDVLLQRGAGMAFAHELPQGALLYLLVRAARPLRVVETGVRPGYSTAWLLAGLDANGAGELTSLGPGPVTGRMSGVGNVTVGQFVPPSLRSRWTLALGNTEDRLREILSGASKVDLFFYDNGPDVARARFELRAAWEALSDRGILLAHHVDSNAAWADFCRAQGVPAQILDAGPPPMGAVGLSSRR